MLTCKEVSRSIASDQLTAAGWRRRLAIKLHLFMCRHCREYVRQMREIAATVKHMLGQQTADPDSRERLRSSILDTIPSGEEEGSHTPL